MYVLKVKIISFGSAETQKETSVTVSHVRSQAWRAANVAINAQIVADISRLRRETEPEYADGLSAVTVNPMTQAARDIAAWFPDLPSAVGNRIAYQVSQHYTKNKHAILSGTRRMPRYRTGMPVPWAPTGVKFMHGQNGRHIVRLSMGRGKDPLLFEIVYGRDSIGHRERIERLIINEAKYGVCVLHDGPRGMKGAYLHVPITGDNGVIPVYASRSLAVHVGHDSIVSTMFRDEEIDSPEEVRHYGRRLDIIEKKAQFEDRRDRARAAISRSKGGHGYRRKFRGIETINNKEARWLRSYYHDISAKVVAAAQWRRVGTVLLEAYGAAHGETPETGYRAATRPFYELQGLIAQKATNYGATLVYVEPVPMRDDVTATRHMFYQKERSRVTP